MKFLMYIHCIPLSVHLTVYLVSVYAHIYIYIYYTHTKPPVYARHSYTMRYQNARLTLILEENTVLSAWMWIVFGKSRSGARQCKVGCVQAEALSTQGRSSS